MQFTTSKSMLSLLLEKPIKILILTGFCFYLYKRSFSKTQLKNKPSKFKLKASYFI